MKHRRGAGGFSAPKEEDSALDTQFTDGQLKSKSLRGGAYTLTTQGVRFGIQFGSTIALSRILAPRDFGLLAMVMAITGFLNIIKDLGLGTATVQSRTMDHDQANTSFWLNIIMGVVLTILFAASAPLLVAIYHEPKLYGLTVLMASSFLLNGLSVQHAALLARAMRFGTILKIELSGLIVSTGVGITLAALGARYWALASMPLIGAVLYAICVWSVVKWHPSRPHLGRSTRRLLSFGGFLTITDILSYGSRSIDNILIGAYWGANLLGLYTRAYQLLLLPIQQINSPIARVAIPALSRLQDQTEKYRRAYMMTQDKLNLVVMPLVAFMVVSSDWLIEVVLGKQWTSAARIFMWLGIAGLLFPAENTTGWLFVSQARTKEMLHVEIAASTIAIAAIVGGVFLGPVYVAAFFALTFVGFRVPLVFWYVGRKGPVRTRDLYRMILFPAGIAVAMAAVLYLFRQAAHPQPLPGLLMSIAIYLLVMAVALLVLPQGRRRIFEARVALRGAGATE